MRLDAYLAETRPEHSRSTWHKLIKQGSVCVDGTCIDTPKYEVDELADITVKLPDAPTQAFDLPILYEDDDVVVVDKPAGVLTHAKGALNEEFSVADFIKDKTTYKIETNRPGIIHRLDRDTSGVLLLVKHENAAKMLMKQFQKRTVKKVYYALVEGLLQPGEAVIDVPIGRNPKLPSTFRADPQGKSAQTHYEVEEYGNTMSFVRLEPITGRTHQLRVHMQYVGHPIIGDRVYGSNAKRLYLHATQLELTLPNSKHMIFDAPLPDEFKKDFS